MDGKGTLQEPEALYHSVVRFVTKASFNALHRPLCSVVKRPRHNVHWFSGIYESLAAYLLI